MIGRAVSHYRVLEEVGSGGMGIVYLAEDVRLNRKAALKFLPPAIARDPQAEGRLLREAQAASTLDHPNIATVYEIGEWEGQLFIAMAYYKGETLRRRIERGTMPIDEVATIAAQIADGLATAHAAGIVHRDLKPANVLITPQGQVKILDFGLAKLVSAERETALSMTGPGTTLGTVAYMAPEQARGLFVDQRADVWSFGAVLYEMLTGRTPFTGNSLTAILLSLATETPAPVRSLRPDTPPELERLITGALQKDPDRRTPTIAEISAQIGEYRARVSGAHAVVPTVPRSAWRHPGIVGATAVLIVLAALAWWWNAGSRRRWAATEAPPEIRRLVEQQRLVPAFDLAIEARKHAPDNPELARVWSSIVRSIRVRTDPPGASVSFAAYGKDAAWHAAGQTPVESIEVPQGLLRWKFEKDGFTTREDVLPGNIPEIGLTLEAARTTPPGMVRGTGPRTPFQIYVNGGELRAVTFPDFWVDRDEVTNRQFKAFVDAGGYSKREYWRHPFVQDGRSLPFEDAIRVFRDATGRPGPAGWELGNYPAGRDDLPVTGVSWYEASAYAAFAGKALPTVYHWDWVAAHGPLTLLVVPFANYSSAGPGAVGTSGALHRFGVRDMAGNVKEWCANEALGGKRYILGGGWDEPAYMFADADARSPMDRGLNFGFRCVKYGADDRASATLTGLVAPNIRDYTKEKPASDTVVDAYRGLYSYDRTLVTATLQSSAETADWRRETVTYSAPYGNEQITTSIFLPKNAKPPYETVILFPGASWWDIRSSAAFLQNPFGAYVAKSGRALIAPTYKGALERGTDGFRSDHSKQTSAWRDHVIAWYKDLARTLDYLETRPDIAMDKVGYFGFSRGGAVAPVLLALEPRIKAAVFWVPGFYLERMSAEVDPINFAPRMKIPVLILNGRYDFTFPESSSQLPLFQTLGTPAAHKRRVVYDSGHNLPLNDAIRESLDWFDRYLGSVNQSK